MEIRPLPSARITEGLLAELYRLCDAAYGTPTQRFFEQIGPGQHLLGFSGGVLVSHLMWVTRWLQPQGSPALRTAYIEMVATDPTAQRRGHATDLLEKVIPFLGGFDLAALCPATTNLYARLGWTFWQGPLGARKEDRLVPTPEERVMIMPLPLTPPLDIEQPLTVAWRPGEVW